MNYLAHLLLADYSEEAMLGALLGDFVKHGQDAAYPQAIRQEILLHRKIDAFTDQHPVNLDARKCFDGNGRRYAGILLDVFYDHLLSQRWPIYSEISLEQFASQFYRVMQKHQELLPQNLLAIMPRFIEQNWLCGYQTLAGVELAIQRISKRLSRGGEALCAALPVLGRDHAFLSEGFERFFSELIAFVNNERERL